MIKIALIAAMITIAIITIASILALVLLICITIKYTITRRGSCV